MERGTTSVLKAAVIGFGLVVLALCVFLLPAGIGSDRTGYYRPILIGMYLPAIPFFIGVFHALKLIGNIEKDKAFSPASIDALRKIKYCGFIISALYAVGMPFIFHAADRDDAPGVVLIGIVLTVAPCIVAVTASVFQRLVQHAVEIQSENDLTV